MGDVLSAFARLSARARAYFAIRGRRYWLTAALVLAASLLLSENLPSSEGAPNSETEHNDADFIDHPQYWLYQQLTQLSPRQVKARYIRLVFIENDAYFDELNAPSPMRRDYLARIVKSLADDHVALIALDFNLHFRDATTPIKVGDFSHIVREMRPQTDLLVRTLEEAADHDVKIVLPKNVGSDDDGNARSLPDVYQPYGLCNRQANGTWENKGTDKFFLSDRAKANIACGYIQLATDFRRVPPTLELQNKGLIDSFSLAIARFMSPEDAERTQGRVVFASFIPAEKLVRDRDIFTSTQLLNPKDTATREATRKALANRIVVVGGHWEKTRGMGDIVDTFNAPGGVTSGALMHVNYAEAVLDGRTSRPVAIWLFDLAFGIGAAFLFASSSRLWAKICIVAAAAVGLLLLQWLVFSLFSTFFDAYLILLGLGLHSIIERLFEPRHAGPKVAPISVSQGA